MDFMKQLEKVVNQVEKIDYTNVHIEIETKTDKFIMDKAKPRNKIGFAAKGGE